MNQTRTSLNLLSDDYQIPRPAPDPEQDARQSFRNVYLQTRLELPSLERVFTCAVSGMIGGFRVPKVAEAFVAPQCVGTTCVRAADIAPVYALVDI